MGADRSTLEAAISEDLAVKRRCFPYGTTPLGATDWVRPDGPKEIKDGKVYCRDIDGGRRGYWIPAAEYLELRKRPFRHIGIWEFVEEDDPAAQCVAWAVNNAASAGRQLHLANERIKHLESAIERQALARVKCSWCGGMLVGDPVAESASTNK